MMDREDELGITINLRSIYDQLQRQNELLNDLKSQATLANHEISSLKLQNGELKIEVASLRTRFNGVLVGLGTGMVVGLPALFALLR